MKKLILCLIFVNLAFADNEALLEKAKILEEQGNYKEAMNIYKEIALQNQKDLQKPDLESQNNRQVFAKQYIPFEDKETSESVGQILSSEFGLYAYNTNYFAPISYQNTQANDRKKNEAKFQISVRKPLSYNILGMGESIEFGYTQTSWWQIYEKSGPFRETNYSPEVFALFLNKDHDSPLKAYKMGFIHTSNGQKGEESRSWNRLYVQGTYRIGNIFVTPTLWYRIPERAKKDPNDTYGDDNPDITTYYGFGELEIKYPYKQHIFDLKLRNNFRENNKNYVDFTWTFPFYTKSRLSKYFGYVNISSGYGDNLIDYQRYINRITLGVAFSR